MADPTKLMKLLEIAEKFGIKRSKVIGTQGNIVPFKKPSLTTVNVDEFKLKNSIDEGSLTMDKVKQEMEETVKLALSNNLNDVELNRALNNAINIDRQFFPPTAEVIEAGSGKQVTGKGLEELIQKQGTRFPPTTDIGKIEAFGKKLEKFVEETSPEYLAKQEAERKAMIARQYEGKGYAGGVFGPSGNYRAVAREFLLDQNAKGKIKLDADTLRNLEDRNYLSGGQPLMYADPIRIMRYHYGDDVFEKIPLDKIPTGARSEILDVMSKVEAPPIKTEPPKTPGGYLTPGEYKANIEELKQIEEAIKRREARFADMTEEEIQNELSQYGGKRSAFEMGLEYDYPEEFAKYKTPKKPEPEEKADGGRIGYAKGKRVKSSIDKLLENLNTKLSNKKSMETVNPKTGEVTTPKKPIKRAEEPTGVTVMDQEPISIVDDVAKQTKEFTDDEIISYIKKYKEEGPTLEEFTKRINEQTGSNFTPEQLAHAYRVKVAYPHSTPIVDSEGKFIGGGLYNPPLDVSISDRDTLTKSIVQTRKAKGLSVPKKYQEEVKAAEVVETSETPPKAGEGRFTKQQVLEKIIESTIHANPTDEYVQKTFPNFIKEIRANPELANNENVWRTFTQDFPENKRLVVYGDDTVDFFTKGENLPEGMKQTEDLINNYGISMEEARRIKQMEPEDQVMEIKKLQILKGRTQNANGGIAGLL